MADEEFAHLAALHESGDQPIPKPVLDAAEGDQVEPVWRNDLGGLTFRAGDRFVKWNPRTASIDLDRERVRLAWLAQHPALSAPRTPVSRPSVPGKWSHRTG